MPPSFGYGAPPGPDPVEFTFEDERRRDAFRQAPVLLAALDAVPDPVNGVLVYPHRGGGSGSRQPQGSHSRPRL